MHDNTPDGADGMFRPQLQSAMAVAGRLGEMLARQRAERNEEMLRAENARRKQLEERFEAERALMRTQLGAIHQPQFWEGAKPEDIAAQYALAQQWEPFDDMARLSREHIHDEIRTRYKLTPEEYLQANNPTPDVERTGEQIDREAQRDHTEAEQQSAAVISGDLQNDVDTQNAAASAQELWDSGDRRAKLADTLIERAGDTPIGREAVAAALATDLSNGTPPSAAVTSRVTSQHRPKTANTGKAKSRDFGRE
ncbi:colicin import membrane protein [Arthrobacter sp. CAN_A214]|uniref:hypothetical protein n=1 Tax=Arthrobacter sp. CAN_A214 TaxID=2787720 RepID=UPI0018CA63BB